MLGADVIVAPVLVSGATSRSVYLPAGEWVHLFRGDVLGTTTTGGTFTVAAPIGTPPAFVRKGTPSETSLRATLIAAGVAQ
jgi:alpha-glucosidase (family GH31 glycosyl hydrolase)